MGSSPVLADLGVKGRGSLADQLSNQTALRPQALTAPANGEIVDRLGFDAMLVTMKTGAVTGAPTAVDVDVKVQHDTDPAGGSMVDALAASQREGAAVSANIPDSAADSEVTFLVDLTGLNRYVRTPVTPNFTGGTSPAIETDVTATLGARNSARDISVS
jgi:hypothetical protein